VALWALGSKRTLPHLGLRCPLWVDGVDKVVD
jgi:hypothetical protein